MATINDLRSKIYDKPQVVLDDRIGTGDGVRINFLTRYSPVMDGTLTVTVGGVPQIEDTDYTFDYSTGLIAFATQPDADDIILADYSYAAFTDEELQAILDSNGGNINLAAGEALTTLLSSRTKLVSWSKGDTKIDYDRVRSDLKQIADKFIAQGRSESGGANVTDIDWEEII